jgi:ceramide glucosyltransferase
MDVSILDVLVVLTAGASVAGLLQALAGSLLVQRFARRRANPDTTLPPITVLKPLYGDEPLLEQALASICVQDYPDWQVVFGVQRADDPAIAVVDRLRLRFPDRDLVLVVDPTLHGPNRKVGNLMNMLPSAHHDVLVIADSDLHVRPDYLRRLIASLAEPGVGLVTTLYAGLPAHRRLPALLGATQITHGFLPSALLARGLGRRDCLGATMCLDRDMLARIGGFEALVPHLADDNVLGQLVRRAGFGVALADTVPATTVPEATLRALFRHELRWARTIRALEPVGFAASVLQYGLFWALMMVILTGGTVWAWVLFLLSWVLRAVAAHEIDRALSRELGTLAFRCPVWLLPLRDLMSVVVFVASHAGTTVDWRGHGMHADTPGRPTDHNHSTAPLRD